MGPVLLAGTSVPSHSEKASVTTTTRAHLQDDPRADGWDSEATAQRLLENLNQIVATQPNEPAALALIATPLRCTDLRPESLQPVYRDAQVAVVRAERQTKFRRIGAEQFLREWHDGLPQDCEPESIHVKCKVISLSKGDHQTATTRVRIEREATTAKGPIGQVAHWQCSWSETSGSWKLTSLQLEDFEESTGRSRTLFVDRTETLLKQDPAWQHQLSVGQPEWMRRLDTGVTMQQFGHHGLAVGDVNGDGLEDLYVCQPAGLPNRLYLHRADGTLTEQAQAAHVDWLEPSMSALLADFDNDGDADLALAADQDIILQLNDGQGVFGAPIVAVRGQNFMSLAAADYDRDGDLDLYATAYFPSNAAPGRIAEPAPLHDAQNGGSNVFLRNDSKPGQLRFSDITKESGLDQNNTRWSFGAAWDDFDEDGDPDLVVANDFGHLNFYRNEDGRFRDVAAEIGLEQSAFGMSAGWGDCNRDGSMDLFIAGMFTAAGSRIVPQQSFLAKESGQRRDQFLAMTTGNALFQNRSNGKFQDISVASRSQMGRWAWAAPFVDINNDGWEDLLVTNGWLTNERHDDL